MRRAPVAVSMDLVQAALGAENSTACAELVGHLRFTDKVMAERAARTLKKISETNAVALLPLRKALLAAAFAATDARVQWNLSLVLGRLPLKGEDKALAVESMFQRLQDTSGLNRTMAMQALMDPSKRMLRYGRASCPS